MKPSIAWAGELKLLGASWSDKDGHTLKLKIAAPNEERPNPFKQFTKRRGGRGGTRFHATLAHVQGLKGGDVIYNGQVMLAGWQDSSAGGYTVTFWVEPPASGVHPFEAFVRNRDSFMAVLIELDEDETPIDQQKRARVEAVHKPDGAVHTDGADVHTSPQEGAGGFELVRAADVPVDALNPDSEELAMGIGPIREVRERTPQRLSQAAAWMCQLPMFWRYISEARHTYVDSKDGAATWMRAELGVESRRMLDQSDTVARKYHETIRKPFVAWQEAEGLIPTELSGPPF
jgi:hypothetical protein